jgi:hypothetical protein
MSANSASAAASTPAVWRSMEAVLATLDAPAEKGRLL